MESSAPHRTLRTGEMLNWYRIERILGRGGFGIIYLAHDTNLDHSVAIKEYIPGDVARRAEDSRVFPLTEEHGEAYHNGLERFISEARNLVRFKHPNIVRVMSVFQENNTAYMVMELEEGVNLREYLTTHPDARNQSALQALIEPIIEGLSEVHRHGFIHRDIKPSNILVRKDGSPVLLDFGSARNAGGLTRQNLTALVSAGYAPLEQYDDDGNMDGQQGPWTDIYALGGVLYHAVSAGDPIDSTRRASAVFNGGKDPLLPATLVGKGLYDDAFLRAIDWALSFRIADRPQSLGDWLPALLSGTRPAKASPMPSILSSRLAASDRPTVPAPVAGNWRTSTSATRMPTAASGKPGRRTLLGVAVLLSGGLIWFVLGNLESETPEREAERLAESAATTEEAAGAETEAATQAEDAARAEALVKAENEARVRAESDARARAEEEAMARAEAEERARAEAEARRRADAEAARLTDAREKAAAEATRAEEARALEVERQRQVLLTESSRLGDLLTRDGAALKQLEETAAEVNETLDDTQRRRIDLQRALVLERVRLERDQALASQAATEAAAEASAKAEQAAAEAAREAARKQRAAEQATAEQAAAEAAAAEKSRLARLAAESVDDEDIAVVMKMFETLRLSIIRQDAAAMNAITRSSPQNLLFEQLMDDFVELDVSIQDIRVRNADKSIAATLSIREMIREDDSRATPSDAYRDRQIVSRRRDGEWSIIDW